MWQIAGRVLMIACALRGSIKPIGHAIAPCVSVDKSKIKRRVFCTRIQPPLSFIHPRLESRVDILEEDPVNILNIRGESVHDYLRCLP